MKYLSGRWLWSVLFAAVLSMLWRPDAAGAFPTGTVELFFHAVGPFGQNGLSSANGVPIASLYQRVLLNILSVRLTPSSDLTLSNADPSWVTIPVPAASGSTLPTEFITTSENFGSSSTLLTAATSELQLDMIPLQNLPLLFNAVSVPANSFAQIELVLDSTTPGYVVPLCPTSVPAGEGCVTYAGNLASQTLLRALFTTPFAVPSGTVQPLVANLFVSVGGPPNADPTSTTVFIAPVISAQGNQNAETNQSSVLGVIAGTVENFDVNTTTVTAESAGTNQIVAATHLNSNGAFELSLPALAPPNSTLYDVYVSGNGAYVVRSRVAVSAGTATSLGTLAVPGAAFGSITGFISDGCNGSAVQAATLELLVPDTSAPGSATSCDLTGTPPAIPSNCVAVATGVSDDQGHYPLPHTAFASVPLSLPPGVPHYDIKVRASGYNTTVPQVLPGTLSCPTSRFPNSCSFALEHGYLSGAIQLSGPNGTGNRLNALVMAEDSGTDKIENVTLSTIGPGAASGGFVMPVPDAAPSSEAVAVSDLDVFASVQGLFQGFPQTNSGNLIGTAARVGAPAADCSTLTVAALSPMDCAGLGSVYGSVTNASPSTTSVRLSKDGVQIMETEPNSIGVAPGNVYNFCAPSDSYVLTHYESGVAQSSVPVTLTKPTVVSSPCSSICQDGNAAGTCLLCQPTTASLP